MEASKTTNKFSAEVRGRAVRMVRERQGEQCVATTFYILGTAAMAARPSSGAYGAFHRGTNHLVRIPKLDETSARGVSHVADPGLGDVNGTEIAPLDASR